MWEIIESNKTKIKQTKWNINDKAKRRKENSYNNLSNEASNKEIYSIFAHIRLKKNFEDV